MILKKVWLPGLEILDIYGHASREEYEQEPSTWIETQNTEKQVPLNRIETQNT